MPQRKSIVERVNRDARDLILFFAGLGGIVHETVRFGPIERPFLLTAFLGMIGLPVVMRRDEKNGE